MKKLRITLNSKVYECTVEVLEDDEQHFPGAMLDPRLSTAPPPAPPAAPPPIITNHGPIKGDPNAILAPIAGTVQKVFVQAGQRIEAKAPVVLLDAMKMDTYIYASKTGTISEVAVAPSQSVQVGTVILRYKVEG